jgi:uncharacterized protein RhaS with RHS repeats
MQQRYYDPQVGRFLSVDPVPSGSSSGDNFGRYWYANDNPIRFTDPDGRCPPDSEEFCVTASHPNLSKVSGSLSMMLSPVSKKSAAEQKNSVRVKDIAKDAKEILGSGNNDAETGEEVVKPISGAKNGQSKTAYIASGTPPKNATYVIHGHNVSSGILDDPEPGALGDAQPLVGRGIPNIAVATNGRMAAHEVDAGLYQISCLNCKFTTTERDQFQKEVDSRQEYFYDQ